eukprot:TRINITY_DN20010_c0_g1_i1.p1 TRINITY_DN20010_c0_g1~~TRINITY_DN20010_c0_g1_i1.p1  ORF type:complete len:634 (-),score=72.11 TRINITY_DN20010_c0_g1_i1:227-2128(-)
MWSVLFPQAQEDGNGDCRLHQPRRSAPTRDIPPRIVPAPDDHGLAVAWQDGDALLLRRFQRDCNAGNLLQLNSSHEFWRQPSGNRLQDAVGRMGGSTVVAWTLNDEVFFRIVHADGQLSPVSRASGSGMYARSEVRVAASRDSGQFALVWQSWGQDGDGWGIFARVFSADGKPLHHEVQVNSDSRGFQWYPKLTWCGNSLWALWTNGTAGFDQECTSEPDQGTCFGGPMVRQLVASGHWDPGTDIALHGGLPLTAALSCAQSSFFSPFADAGDTIIAVWLERSGREVRWEYLKSTGPWHIQFLSQLLMTRRLQLNPELLQHQLEHGEDLGETPPKFPSLRQASGRLQKLEEASKHSLDPGQVEMLAYGNFMMLLTQHRSGILGAQLVQYVAVRPLTFSRHTLASSSLFGSAAWDPFADELGVLSCWASGGALDADEPSAFECARHSAGWLVRDEVSGPMILARALGLVFAVAAFCWMVVGSAQRILFRSNWFGSGRRASGRRDRRLSRSQRQREVRRQLEQIPGTPRYQAAEASSEDQQRQAEQGDFREQLIAGSFDDPDGEASGEDSELAPCPPDLHDRDSCSICHERVGVWVALRPCGHTACRHCTLRLAETSLKCHMCRSGIKGVQAVYI